MVIGLFLGEMWGMYHIKNLKTKGINGYYQEDGIEQDWITNLSKINIFVGSNNSGKSRLIRSLCNINTFEFTNPYHNLQEINECIRELKSEIESCITGFNIVDYNDFIEKAKGLREFNELTEGYDHTKEIFNLLHLLINQNGHGSVKIRYSQDFYRWDEINTKLNGLGEKYEKILTELIGGYSTQYKFERLYIPTLRGLRPFYKDDELEEKDIYHHRTKKDYFSDNDNAVIFTGLSLYEDIKGLLLGNLAEREKVAKFQKFLGDTFFDGQEIALIPSKNSDVVAVKIGDEQEKPIYNLGDGIQSVIVLTFPLFMREGTNQLVFIEEPELYLHPGLQRKLIETFMRFDNFQYFITTHSNHFLDITLDIPQISIYTFKKELEEADSREKGAKFYVENVSNEDSNVLELLGVKNSSMFLANCTIWVEGITDRFYLRKYLQIYQSSLDKNEPRFREDYHYAFVEYSGNNITHWSFLDEDDPEQDEISKSMNADKICGKLFLITDKDSDKKNPRHEKLRERLGERYYCLECKEIENLLSSSVLIKTIRDYEGEEPKFTRKISEAEYKGRYIGKYIDDRLQMPKRKGKYGDKSGTIKNKINFCEKSLKHIESLDDMSEEAKELSKKIYEFIKINNL